MSIFGSLLYVYLVLCVAYVVYPLQETCCAIKGTGRRIDTNIKHGMTWLCTILDKLFDKLNLRVQEDMEIAAKVREEENAARKERVRKAREERYDM